MSIQKKSPDMNITNQINAGLNDVRMTLIDLSCLTGGPAENEINRAKYELDLVIEMIEMHKRGNSISWSDRKPQVDEEFG